MLSVEYSPGIRRKEVEYLDLLWRKGYAFAVYANIVICDIYLETGAAYDPETSAGVRFCVYVETDYDMDGDGRRDLVKAFVQVPRNAVMGHYKAPVIFEARPPWPAVTRPADITL